MQLAKGVDWALAMTEVTHLVTHPERFVGISAWWQQRWRLRDRRNEGVDGDGSGDGVEVKTSMKRRRRNVDGNVNGSIDDNNGASRTKVSTRNVDGANDDDAECIDGYVREDDSVGGWR